MIAIASISANWIIGNNEKLPWEKQKEDLAFFREKTLNKTILVGRKTFEKLPRLENRTIYILTRDIIGCPVPRINGKIVVTGKKLGYVKDNKETYINFENQIPKDCIVCGGAEIYRQFIPKCSELFLTIFEFDAIGDTNFPFNWYEITKMFPKNELVKLINQGKIWRFYK